MSNPTVQPGDVLVGKYRVERVLGAGGMGVVVAAHHLQLDVPVALKFLLEGANAHRDSVARFIKEGRAAARIRSEHIVRVFDVGTLENGSPYLVMEYLEGNDLGRELEKAGRLPVEVVAGYVSQACDAVAEAHSLGIVHRDLKPQNLFLTRRKDGSPCVKVLDFGIAKLGVSTSDPLTRTSALMGSPLYMAPEVMFSARNADSRTDIWALGVILYQLSTGRPPFTGETMPEIVLKVTQTAPEPPRAIQPSIPSDFEQVILRCLEKAPDQRFQKAEQLAAALQSFVVRDSAAPRTSASSPLPLAETSAPAGTAAPTLASTAGAWGATQAPKTRRVARALAIGLGVIVVGALSLGVWFATHSKVSAEPAASLASPSAAPVASTPASPVDFPGSGADATPGAAVAPSVEPPVAPVAASAVSARAAPGSRTSLPKPLPSKPGSAIPIPDDRK